MFLWKSRVKRVLGSRLILKVRVLSVSSLSISSTRLVTYARKKLRSSLDYVDPKVKIQHSMKWMLENVRNKPFKHMSCPGCKKIIEAAAWWTEDEGMLDWYCPNCFETLETVIFDSNTNLIEYLAKVKDDEFPIF